MKFISWNVNGLRACMNKNFLDTFYELNADFFCLQETKLQQGQIDLDLPGYEQYWCYAEKKGYSGTAIFTKHTPQSVTYGMGVEELDTEGRLITLEYPEFYLVTCYTPNAQRGLARIEHRLKWESAFRAYLTGLDRKKPVILCGDLNVAHQEIDLKNPSSNRGSAGFSDEERGAFTQLLDSGFTDSFRYLYPDKTGAYSWWSYMFNARANNAGWRIDYFVVSDRLKDSIYDATIHPDYLGSDHCPVGLDLNITCNGGIWSPEIERATEVQQKQTDGVSPVGPIVKCSIAALLLVTVLGTAYFMTRPTQPSGSTGATESPSEPLSSDPNNAIPLPNLVKEVIDRSGSIKTVLLSSPDFTSSSSIPEAFTDGNEVWKLTSPTLSSLVPNNFHIQLVFSSRSRYTDQNKPELSYKFLGGISNDYITHVYYYDYDGTIAGCFLYGHTEKARQVFVTVTYTDSSSPSWISQRTEELTIGVAEYLVSEPNPQ